jgi:chemotaxis protein methyltransferase CheR
MDTRVFEEFSKIIYERSGITLRPGKESLVASRVQKRMRSLRIVEYRDYLDHVLGDSSGQEMVLLLDAISTNLTFFFREPDHFELLGKVVRDSLSTGQRRLRIWSAASSSGEEPYSMGMTVLEALQDDSVDARILATDLSTRMLDKCHAGVNDAGRLKDVPPAMRQKYFQKSGRGDGAHFEVGPRLRSLISFRRLNLSTPPFPMQGPFDVVFCRNVMIYFDKAVRERLVGEIYRLLRPGGWFIVSHSESLMGLKTSFRQIRPSVFVK